MGKRSSFNEWLTSSPWTLAAGALAAVLTFFMTAAEQGIRLYEWVRAPSDIPSVEVAYLRGFQLLTVSKEVEQIPSVREALRNRKFFSSLINKKSTKATVEPTQLPVWPVQLLILNPGKENLSVHSCRMSVRIPSRDKEIPAQSWEYFVTDELKLSQQDAARPIVVNPRDAKRVQLVFLFVGIDNRPDADKPRSADLKSQFQKIGPTRAEISCKDQSRRELRTTSTMWGPVDPRDGEASGNPFLPYLDKMNPPVKEEKPSQKPDSRKTK